MVDDHQASINDERAITFASGEYLGKDLQVSNLGYRAVSMGFRMETLHIL